MSQDGGASVVLRRERTRGAVARLALGVADWLDSWSGAGPQTSQIMRCGAVLGALVTRLEVHAAELGTDDAAFAACRDIDADLAVVERMWRLLRDRFGQRLAPAPLGVRQVLAAADELIWSCVQQAKPAAQDAQPLPLAYLEPAFSASATPRTKPPPSAPVQDRQLAELLKILPVPLIGLPVGVADEPWWLAVLAHEVGHHVQFDLDADAVDRTQALLETTGGDAWGAWRWEVFADVFSVVALGTVAIAVVAELEWSSVERMVAAAGLYPPVAVRLALMAEVARELGLGDAGVGAASWAPRLAALPAGGRRTEIDAMLAAAPAAAKALLDMPLGVRTLRALATSEVPERVAVLRRRLAGDNVGVTRSTEGPRLAVAVAFDGYRGLAGIEAEAARGVARTALQGRVLPLVADAADDTVIKRGAPRPSGGTMKLMVDTMFDRMRAIEREGAG